MLMGTGASMFGDPDTGWHLATGDLIRESGAIPQRDPWSFTAGDKQWIILSWGWDVASSYLYQHFGWPGIVAMNSITIAAFIAVLFAATFVGTRNATAAFLATLLASITITINVRPFHVTFLMIALLWLLLSQVARGQCSRRWLLALPPLMGVWINGHGGFLFGFFLLGIHGLHAIMARNRTLTLWLLATGIASLVACCINPYGADILLSISKLFTSDAKPYLSEWAALDFSSANMNLWIYLVAFVTLVMMRNIPAPAWEKWIVYLSLLSGIISIRNMPIFAIVAAPMLTLGIRDAIMLKTSEPPVLHPFVERLQAWASRLVHSGRASLAAVAGCVALSLWVFSPQAASFYALGSITLPPDLSAEIAYIEAHHPKARLINSYNLGGQLVFASRGKVPVFIDGREGTAYPRKVVQDYFAFRNSSKNWEAILDRYQIDGILIGRDNDVMIDRLIARRDWHLAFKGPSAMIFMRDKPKGN